jgi:hypothetical protein
MATRRAVYTPRHGRTGEGARRLRRHRRARHDLRGRSAAARAGQELRAQVMQLGGGVAANAAVAVVALGGAGVLWSRVGDDPTGTRIVEELAACGVEADAVRQIAGLGSPLSTVLVEPGLGARGHSRPGGGRTAVEGGRLMEISAGKLWGPRRLADNAGRFKMTAIDQRPPIINLVKERRRLREAPCPDVVAVKRAPAEALAPLSSAGPAGPWPRRRGSPCVRCSASGRPTTSSRTVSGPSSARWRAWVARVAGG